MRGAVKLFKLLNTDARDQKYSETFRYVWLYFFLLIYIKLGDYLSSVQSRGKQCAFMSLSALLTAQNIPLIDWSKTTFINNVLLQFTRRQNVLASSE